MGKMMVPRGMVLLQRSAGWFEAVATKGLEPSLIGQSIPLHDPMNEVMTIESIDLRKKPWARFFVDRSQKLLVPMIVRGNTVGLLALGERLGGKDYTDLEVELIGSLVELSGSAIEKGMMIEELQAVNRNLDRKLQELNTLFELGKEFSTELNADRLIRLLTFALLGQTGALRYAICLVEEGSVNIVSSRLDGSVNLLKAMELCCTLSLPMLVDDLERNPTLKSAAAEFRRSGIEAVIPMQVQNKTKGLIFLGARIQGQGYSPTDLEFLYSLSNLAIISVENARLFKEEVEKRRMEDELKIAREIQQGLLPRSLPSMSGFELAGINIPSKFVGGDYYDIVQRTNDEFILAVGDVSGKGVPASLLMASVQAAMKALANAQESLSDITVRLNEIICSNTGLDRYITFFWGILNTSDRTFRYVNAGHNQPFLIRPDGSVKRLAEGGMILGIMKAERPYEEGAVRLEPGDVLVLFTDGVSEAMNREGLDFTEERLQEVLVDSRTLTAEEIIQRVRKEVDAHVNGTPQSDDFTLVVVRATGN